MDMHTATTRLTACNDASRALDDALYAAQRRGDALEIENAHRALQANGAEKTKLEDHLYALDRAAMAGRK
jgi:hypothetical protein